MLYLVIAFIIALAYATYGHITHNKKLSTEWHKHLDGHMARWLDQFAWSRTIQLLLAISAGLLSLLLFNHFQMEQHNANLKAVNNTFEERLSELKDLKTQIQSMQDELHQSMIKNASQRIAEVAVSAKAVPPTYMVKPTEVITDERLGERINAQAQKISIEDIYNPEMNTDDDLSEMDAIKKRYEGLIVNYLFLKKCGLIDSRDYHSIISALATEMASVNAPGRLEHDITTAAQGSYKEMYAQSSCQGEEIEQLHHQYSDYIKTISGNVLSAP